MAHTRQSFLIPELNVVANDAQLKNLQHRILFDHYSKDAQQKLNRSESQKKTYRNYYNPEQRADTEVDYQNLKSSLMYNKSFGIDLAESYQKEMERKEAKKRQQKESQRRQEQMMIQVAQNQLYLDKARAIEYQESFKKQAIQQLEAKQRKKAEQRRQQELEKEAFQRRYSTNLTSLAKQESFRKHYNNVNGAFEANERNYLSFVAPANKYIQQEKDRLIQNSIKKSETKLRQQLQKQFIIAQRHRTQLRDSLVMQIRQKQQKKKQEINEMRSQGYTSNTYLTRHHPINNPVDFKITHDNKYIIKELQSGLARSGSQSILS